MLFQGLPSAFIGLALTFASVALLATTITDTLASIVSWRSRTLVAGLADLLNVGDHGRDWLSATERTRALLTGERSLARQFVPAGNVAWNAVHAAKTNLVATETSEPARVAQAEGDADPAVLAARVALRQAHDVAVSSQGNLLAGLLRNAGVAPLVRGTDAGAALVGKARPDAIPAQAFAGALLDVIHFASDASTDRAAIEASLDRIADPQLRSFLLGAWHRADGRIASWQADVASWYDEAMEQVSAIYRRDVRMVSFLVGFAAAVAGNVDAVDIAGRLFTNPALTADIHFSPNDTDALSKLASRQSLETLRFPVGWAQAVRRAEEAERQAYPGVPPPMRDFMSYLLDIGFWVWRLPGFLITAMAAMFGAPFWFDAIRSISRFKGGSA